MYLSKPIYKAGGKAMAEDPKLFTIDYKYGDQPAKNSNGVYNTKDLKGHTPAVFWPAVEQMDQYD